eukprot:1143517-Pelagomonas_calceolata.AAC.2
MLFCLCNSWYPTGLMSGDGTPNPSGQTMSGADHLQRGCNLGHQEAWSRTGDLNTGSALECPSSCVSHAGSRR